MTTFDERESAAEAAFAHDEDCTFARSSHRNREIGCVGGAAKLGKTGDDAADLCRSPSSPLVWRRAATMSSSTGSKMICVPANVRDRPRRHRRSASARLMSEAVLAQNDR